MEIQNSKFKIQNCAARWQARVYTTQEAQEWNILVKGTGNNDVYFLCEYSRINELNFQEKAHLFSYGDAENYVIYPFLKRRINDLPAFKNLAEEYFDVITPYGFGGPLQKQSQPELAAQVIHGFLDSFHNYCLENNIVSEFARLHPFLNNHVLFSETGGAVEQNPTVYVDLTLDEKTILKGLRENHQRDIKKAEKAGVTICEDLNFEYLDAFYDTYTETMKWHQAREFYFFQKKYFEDMVKLLPENVKLFVAQHQGSILSGLLLFHKDNIVQYHLGGNTKEGFRLGAYKLLFWHAFLWAKTKEYRCFHLGGGFANAKDDAVFQFKSGFSRHQKIFWTYRKIHNETAYKELCELKLTHEKQPAFTDNRDFFPLYRR